MTLRSLDTTSAVMDELGGNSAVAALTSSKYNAVCNWRNAPTFPSNTYVAMIAALEDRGCTAAASLWGMKEPAAAEPERQSA